jgi:hypothetical protein
LEKLVEIHRKLVLSRFDDDARKSIEELVKALSRDIVRSPPEDFTDQLGPTAEDAKDYLRLKLAAQFPKADKVAEGMRVSRVVKDVTCNTLNEPGFIDWLKEQFPLPKTCAFRAAGVSRLIRRSITSFPRRCAAVESCSTAALERLPP